MEKTWSVTFPNYTVSGIASCNNTNGNGYATPYSGNQSDIQQGTTGTSCWCRIMTPVRSAWVFNFTESSIERCMGSCAADCAYDVRNDKQLRGGVFTSAGQ